MPRFHERKQYRGKNVANLASNLTLLPFPMERVCCLTEKSMPRWLPMTGVGALQLIVWMLRLPSTTRSEDRYRRSYRPRSQQLMTAFGALRRVPTAPGKDGLLNP